MSIKAEIYRVMNNKGYSPCCTMSFHIYCVNSLKHERDELVSPKQALYTMHIFQNIFICGVAEYFSYALVDQIQLKNILL